MTTLVYTSPDGVTSTILADVDIEALITAAKIICNQYSDNSKVEAITTSKTYTDSIAGKIAADLTISLPVAKDIITACYKVKVSDNVTLTLRDQSYIDALGTACKLYINNKLTEFQQSTDTKILDLQQQIQVLDVEGCTFETWLNYWARLDSYLDPLYDTVDEDYYRQMGWVV